MNKLTNAEKEKLKNINIVIEDRDYSNEEIRGFEIKVVEELMNKSLKNNDFSKNLTEINNILDKMIK